MEIIRHTEVYVPEQISDRRYGQIGLGSDAGSTQFNKAQLYPDSEVK